jgi:hypothetical protein
MRRKAEYPDHNPDGACYPEERAIARLNGYLSSDYDPSKPIEKPQPVVIGPGAFRGFVDANVRPGHR